MVQAKEKSMSEWKPGDHPRKSNGEFDKKPVELIRSGAGVNDKSVLNVGHEADTAEASIDMQASLARLNELEDAMRAYSVESLGSDIFEPRSSGASPVAADPSQAMVEVFDFGNQGGDWQEYSDARIAQSLEQAQQASDPAERARLIQVATGYATAASFGMWHQSQAMRAAGMDPHEGYDAEERAVAEKLEEMAARDWDRNQQGVTLDQWELPKALAPALADFIS